MIAPGDLEVDLESNTARVGAKIFDLGSHQAVFLYIVARASKRGDVAAHDDLIRGIWGTDEPLDPRKELHIFTHHLRKKLAGTSLQIVNRWSEGYELTRDPSLPAPLPPAALVPGLLSTLG